MSRWSGPARRGARKVMLDLKRTEAETRQAAERARRRTAALELGLLTHAEIDARLAALLAMSDDELLRLPVNGGAEQTWTGGVR